MKDPLGILVFILIITISMRLPTPMSTRRGTAIQRSVALAEHRPGLLILGLRPGTGRAGNASGRPTLTSLCQQEKRNVLWVHPRLPWQVELESWN